MILVFLIAAGPAILMFRYVYKKDTIEKEPRSLLWKLVIFGALSVILALILELVGGTILVHFIPNEYSRSYILTEMFIVVALSEELSKFLALKLGSWRNPAFNYTFDGLIYAICVAIGFSVVEDIMYIASTSLATGIVRALTFIPGHFGFAVFTGLVYSKAREAANKGNRGATAGYQFLAVILGTVMHGFYDSCLSFGTNLTIVFFLVFVVAMYIAVFLMIRKASLKDRPIG